ncbi:uncharacterized protein [Haliotis cracherodii]|uniref:uncharacterized protein n=1 Tax=Haliotis cracherodii TaxID=6455 RepID=UPI0039ECE167
MMSSSEDSGLQGKSVPEKMSHTEIRVVGVAGGSVTHAQTTGCSFESQATINTFVCKSNGSDREPLQVRTLHEITNKTPHCIKTHSLSKVLRKCQRNIKCVTITGLPGDGKTTLAYMALSELQHHSEVFAIKSAKEYFTITSDKCSKDACTYIMINDVFGMCVFEKESLKEWSGVLKDVLFDRFERRHDPMHIKLLLVGRTNVFQEARGHLSKFEALVIAEDNLVDLSSPSYKLSFKEKVQIFEVYSEKRIDEKTRDEVCALSTPHGFPNCCTMFFSMMKQRKLKPTEFFTNPIRFLMQTTKVLIAENASYKRLFKEIIQMDGELDHATIGQRKPLMKDVERRKAVNELTGSFIEEQYDCVVFKHPSIFETVSLVIGTIDPLFVIECCSMQFWNHQLKLKRTDAEHTKQYILEIGREYIADITQRVAKELNRGNLRYTLRHDIFNDKDFVEGIFQFIKDHYNWEDLLYSRNVKNMSSHLEETRPPTSISKAHLGTGSTTLIDKKSFLFLCTSCTSDHLLRLIHEAFQLPKFAVENLLFGACQNNAESSVTFIFTHFPNVNVNIVAPEGDTPLIASSVTGNINILDLLMKHGANPNATNRWNSTPLHYLCARGHLKGVQMMIPKIEDINKIGHNENTALHEAARHQSDRSQACVQLLIESNAEINVKNNRGATPLHEAVMSSNGETVKYLLEAGAYPHSEDNSKTSPLMSASLSGSFDIVEVLLNRKADIMKQDVYGYTALHLASKAGHKDVVRILLQRGADMNMLNKDKKTAFHLACQNGNEESVKILIDFRADIHHRDWNTSPFHLACYNGHVGTVRILLDAGVDIEDKDKGVTPLVIACKAWRLQLLEFLVERNANVYILDSDLNSLLHIVARHVHGGHTDITKILLNQGLNINATNKHGETPLFLACERGHVDLVRLLVSKKADLRESNTNGKTPLHEACYPVQATTVPKAKQDITLILINTGVCVNVQDKSGQIPLHCACDRGYHFADMPDSQKFLKLLHNAQLHKVKYLLEHDANINCQDNSGRTPLHKACDPPELAFFVGDHAEYKERYYMMRAELVNALIQNGADTNIYDKKKIPSLHGWFERNLDGVYTHTH